MKMLLVQKFEPREPRTPIAIMDLAAYGRMYGHQIDVAYADDLPRLKPWHYDAIGISALSYEHEARHVITMLRHRMEAWPISDPGGRNPGVILGGKVVPVLTIGEREELRRNHVLTWDLLGEKLFWANATGALDAHPAWSAADYEALAGKPGCENMVELMASRGCPYHCHFCHNTEKTVRWFSPERTVANARLLLERFQRGRVFFVDDIFSLRPEKMVAILDEADRQGCDMRGRASFFVHVNHLKEENLRAINTWQPMEIQIGIESGDDGMLKAMGKTFTAAEAEDALDRLHRRGHRVACLFIMGFPGETRETLQATVGWMNRNRAKMSGWWVGYYQPIRGTRGWQMAKERVGRDITGTRNTEVTYVDPNLTEVDLREARAAGQLY